MGQQVVVGEAMVVVGRRPAASWKREQEEQKGPCWWSMMDDV